MDKKIFGLALLFLAAALFAQVGPELPMAFYGVVTATSGSAVGQTLTATLGASSESATVDASSNYQITIGRVPGDTTSTNVEFSVGSCSLANATFASSTVVELNLTVPSECLLAICGDAACNRGETCSSCAADCGTCPGPSGPSGGGGGGGGRGGGGAGGIPNPQNPPVEVQEELPPNTLPVNPEPSQGAAPVEEESAPALANEGPKPAAPTSLTEAEVPAGTPQRGFGDTLAAMVGDFDKSLMVAGIGMIGLLGLLALLLIALFFLFGKRRKKKEEKK
jgi:hypothetical protein